MKKILKQLFFVFVCFIFMISIFYKIIFTDTVIIPFAITPFNICEKFPTEWEIIKKIYILVYLINSFIISEFLYKKINIKKTKNKTLNKIEQNEFRILIGKNSNGEKKYINEKGLYQNILVTGTIGSGKTSSALYPITEQIVKYNAKNEKEKFAMLILDVKGNYYKKVLELAQKFERKEDVILIEVGGNYKYNPLDKKNLNPQVLSNRLRVILELFSPNNSESFWLDKVEQILAEEIKLCRLYNNRIC